MEDYLSDRDICNNDGNSAGARAAYVEDYSFDIPEGIDLMVHYRSRSLDDCETQRDSTVSLPRLYSPLVVDRVTDCLTEIKVPGWSLALSGDMYTGARRCVCTRGTPLGVFSAGRISLTLIGHRACLGGSVSHSDWSCLDCAVDFSPWGVWIGYIRPDLEDGTLIDAAPVTWSLVASTLFSCRDVYCTAGFSSDWTFCGTDRVLPAGYQMCLHWIAEHWTMAASGASVVDDRAGIMFGVELYLPWDAPDAVVDVSSAGVVPLRNVPDVIGLVGRREGAAESRVLQGRDARSVRVLVPDCRGLDQNFHDVTIVDMGDVPESHISLPELSTLIQQWPAAVINHMGWCQRELEEMRAAAKTRYRQSRPSCCTFCGILIKCDMYRHVVRCHLDLAQLWRCSVSWCTVWKGTPRTVWTTFGEPMMCRGDQVSQLGEVSSAMDSYATGVDGFADAPALRDLYRRAVVQ